MNAFFFGLGFSSRAALTQLRIGSRTVNVSGSVRTQSKADPLTDEGVDAHVFDGSAPGATLGPSLRRASHVVFSIAPGADGEPALVHHRPDLDAAEKLQRHAYYSPNTKRGA